MLDWIVMIGLLVFISLIGTQVDIKDDIRDKRYMLTPQGYHYYYL
jgi:hypothetical protein